MLLGSIIAVIGFYLPWLVVSVASPLGGEPQIQRISGYGLAQALSDAGVAWLALFAGFAAIITYAFLHYARREHETRIPILISTLVALLVTAYALLRVHTSVKSNGETSVSLKFEYGLAVLVGGWLIAVLGAFLSSPVTSGCSTNTSIRPPSS
ncbi:MAG: hypothetical protein ABIK43_03035 [candidate division WOR-3 bacterium]